MKVCIIQPPYPHTPDQTEDSFKFIIGALTNCAGDVDLIMLPEYCNAPSHYGSRDEFIADVNRFTDPLLDAVTGTARRCGALVGVNLAHRHAGKLRNTTLLYGQSGNIVAAYDKRHLVASEIAVKGMDDSYTFEPAAPPVVEVAGVRFGFLTCYDFYFNEYIAHLAAQKPDIILSASHQRAERQDILEAIGKMCAFNCNAYLVRASVSMGTDSKTGGCSMLVAPDGKILVNFEQKTGAFVREIDPHLKYMRSNGFAQPEIRNDQYIENGRQPWAYRTCGKMVKPNDNQTPYPRICAHRGFSVALPENTMPALAAAVALGVEEIECDMRSSVDGRLFVCHDPGVDRVSSGKGGISELTGAEINRLDAGNTFAPVFAGLKFAEFEEVLKAFSRQVIINLHVKSIVGAQEYDPVIFQKVVDLIYEYDFQEHIYIAGEASVLEVALKMAPELKRCCLAGARDYSIVENAVKYQCQKLQFHRKYFNVDMLEKAHVNGIKCNLFWSDDPVEADKFIRMGIDTILTNNCLKLIKALRDLQG